MGIERVDALDVGGESVVVERSVVGEGKGGAAEVSKGKVERMLEPCLAVCNLGGRDMPVLGCVLAGNGLGLLAERVQVENLSVVAWCEVELIRCRVGSGFGGI